MEGGNNDEAESEADVTSELHLHQCTHNAQQTGGAGSHCAAGKLRLTCHC